MPRRTHKKSRNGCVECKRRHIKCDERHPICSNCISSERECCYLAVRSPVPGQPGTPSHSPPPALSTSTTAESSAAVDTAGDIRPVDMAHATLFYHFASQLQSIFEIDQDHSPVSFLDITQYTLSAPYLLNQILAISALHLSITQSDQSDMFQHQSIQLQTHALSIFNEMSPAINEDSCVGTFLFSSLLGTNLLCNCLVFREPTFPQFLSVLAQSLRLHQGVRAVAGQCWSSLNKTPLAPLFNSAHSFPQEDIGLGPQCQKLCELVRSANLDSSVTSTYERAINILQRVMHAAAFMPASHGSSHALLAWPVCVPSEYVELVASRQPEALVILAHYGALLHHRRDCWIFGDGGQYIIESVNQELGSAWGDAMDWPNVQAMEKHT